MLKIPFKKIGAKTLRVFPWGALIQKLRKQAFLGNVAKQRPEF